MVCIRPNVAYTLVLTSFGSKFVIIYNFFYYFSFQIQLPLSLHYF